MAYISICNAPELDQLGIEISKVVQEFLSPLNIDEQAPNFLSVTQHENYLELLEKIFGLIHETTKQLSP